MFQFPGFALLSLCIQPKSTCFTRILIGLAANNIQMSGGLPHSEIEGSKLITSSPSLIAGYHVLHRLLLPRHPPNALIALDLIQKEPNCAAYRYARSSNEQGLLCPLFHNLNQKLVLFPLLFDALPLRYLSADVVPGTIG